MEVRTYGQYCPVARATEILAMRWTPIIVRNLLLGCETFGELMDGAPGIPRTLLSSRLELLEQYGVIERVPSGRGSRYLLTEAGPRPRRGGPRDGDVGRALARGDAGALRLPHGPVVAVPAHRRRGPARPAARDPLRAERRAQAARLGRPLPARLRGLREAAGLRRGPGGDDELGVAGEVAHGPDLARAGDARGPDLGRGTERARADAVDARPEPLRRRRAGARGSLPRMDRSVAWRAALLQALLVAAVAVALAVALPRVVLRGLGLARRAGGVGRLRAVGRRGPAAAARPRAGRRGARRASRG